MTERPSANPFARTRQDHRSEVAEDYVELIYQLGKDGPVRTAQLVDALRVAQPTVTKALDRLQRDGLVIVHPRQSIELTDEGEAIARESEERHDLIVRFLVSIGVDRDAAELDAEGIEHHVSAATQKAIARYLRS